MSSVASIVYLRLDANHDPIFDPGAELSDLDAVAQAILTRLELLQGEWWENLNEGTPMFQQIIGRRLTQNQQQVISLALTARIQGTPFVSAVEDLTIAFDEITRAFAFRCTAKTSFGTVPITFSPGLNASVG